jgi:hypothetical protein
MKSSGLKIKNWHQFQHFKNRTPPWIKLHKAILDQRDINAISDCSFRILIGLWLIASEDEDMQGGLPGVEDIAFRLRVTNTVLTKALDELKHFLIRDDITLISERYQDDDPEADAEAEKRKEAEADTLALGEFKNVKMTKTEHEKLLKKHGAAKLAAGIEIFGDWLKTSGKRSKDHYASLKETSWVWQRHAEKTNGQPTKPAEVPCYKN